MRVRLAIAAIVFVTIGAVGGAPLRITNRVQAVEGLQSQQAPSFTDANVIEGPQQPPYVANRPIAIVGGLLIDATGAPPKHDQAVIIDRGRIVDVGPMEQVEVPKGARVIDAAGMTILPGLIDSNCHIV